MHNVVDSPGARRLTAKPLCISTFGKNLCFEKVRR